MNNATDASVRSTPVPAAPRRPKGLRLLWQRLILRRQARRDYENARGTLHVEMLRKAQARLDVASSKWQAELQAVERERAALQAQCDEELVRLLSRYLVLTRLDEVRGMAPKTKADIIRDVFDDHLEDLRSAQWVAGVSEGCQRAINDWILHYRRQFPALLEEDFPGRRQVMGRYEARLERFDVRLRVLRARVDDLVALRERVGQALARLWPVTVQDFVTAARDPTDATAYTAVQGYLRGVFAEWEPMPEWFRRACTVAEDE